MRCGDRGGWPEEVVLGSAWPGSQLDQGAGTPPVDKAQYYSVVCPLGHRLRGQRTGGYQALRCPSCGEGIFVLPASPLPDRLPPARSAPARTPIAAVADVDEGPIELKDPAQVTVDIVEPDDLAAEADIVWDDESVAESPPVPASGEQEDDEGTGPARPAGRSDREASPRGAGAAGCSPGARERQPSTPADSQVKPSPRTTAAVGGPEAERPRRTTMAAAAAATRIPQAAADAGSIELAQPRLAATLPAARSSFSRPLSSWQSVQSPGEAGGTTARICPRWPESARPKELPRRRRQV